MRKLFFLQLMLISSLLCAQTPMKLSASAKSNNSYNVGLLKEYTISDVPLSLARMSSHPNDSLYLTLPVSVKGKIQNITLALGRKVNDTEIKYSNGDPYVSDGSVDYRGYVQGKTHSMTSVSVNGSVINGIAIFDSASYDIVRIPQGTLIYNVAQLTKPSTFHCDDLSVPDSIVQAREMMKQDMRNRIGAAPLNNCVQIGAVVRYEIYAQKLASTASYMTGLFNQVQMLYAYDSIQVKLKSLLIFNQPDPFVGPSTINFLNSFQSWLATNFIDGDVRMLFGTSGGGGVAYVDALCTGNYNIGYCGISLSYSSVPTYSWSVEVWTHEMGHILGSQHTHACVWNGNNTAIDNCGPTAGYGYEGTCSGAPTPLNGGTIMSYCHLLAIQINFSLGFGPQPRARIMNRVQTRPCLHPCDSTYNPPPLDSNCYTALAPTTWNISTSSAKLVITPYTGGSPIMNYQYEYRRAADTAWIISPKTVLSYFNITGLAATTKYVWRCQTFCTLKTSNWTDTARFTTLTPNLCVIPTGLAKSAVTTTGATLSWVPSGAIVYNVRWRITGSNSYVQKQVSSNATNISGLSPATSYSAAVQGQCPTIGSPWSPEITFSTLGGVDTCAGKPVPDAWMSFCLNLDSSYTFNAHGATNVTYQWRKNGGAVISTASQLGPVTGLVHGDEISLTVTFTDACKKATTVKRIL